MSEDFFELSASTQARIDEAFNHALGSVDEDSLIRLTNESSSSHGFENLNSENDKMPHLVVPQALKFLNLPQDDEDILQVLRTASQAWNGNLSASVADNSRGFTNGFISRKDWRAVCAAVVEDSQRDVDGDATRQNGAGEDDLQGGYLVEDTNYHISHDFDDSYDMEDIYSKESSAPETDTHSDYNESPVISKSGSKRKNKRYVVQGQISSRQKRMALEAFALFLPSFPTSEEEITERLTVDDLDRVVKSLKENMKSDEISEMITWFSSSTDKTLGFDEFTRIMIMTGLV